MPANDFATARLPRISVALISASSLAYEVLLIRLFSIVQWHHFAYMIISLALLGYGLSGTFLALQRHRLLRSFVPAYLGNALLFGLAIVLGYLGTQQIPFNPQALIWDPGEPLRLMAVYLLLMLPFFFAANAIGLALMHYRTEVPRLYAADLFGAGLGSIGIILLLFAVFPHRALQVIATSALLVILVGAWELGLHRRRRYWVLALALLLPWITPTQWLLPRISEYKSLSQTLEIGGTRIIDERSGPLGAIAVVQSTKMPLRHAPGLSLNAHTEPPPQLAIFTDGDGLSAITRFDGDTAALAYLDQTTSALPYHLSSPGSVLVLGAGGGAEVLQARYHGIERIDAVELNPQIVELVQTDHGGFAGQLYRQPGVHVHVDEARGFVASTDASYDLIQVALLDAFSASSAGLYALSESYLYTVEALNLYRDRLTPGGHLALTRWIKLPPRDSLKLVATAVDALERAGVAEPGRQLVMIRGWQTSTLLVKNGDFTDTELAALKRFCQERAFDLAYYPGMRVEEANRYNILRRPYFFEATQAILGDGREAFFADYKFQLRPATDDRPYFFHFFKWRVLPEILALRGQGGMSLLESGYLVLVTTLVQALVASLVLILLPLSLPSMRPAVPLAIRRRLVFMYFFALGLAFMFLEIAFIQKFILFLHHPLYAAAVVLTAFLVFAGMGSARAQRLVQSSPPQTTVARAVAAIAAIGAVYVLALGPLFGWLIGLPELVKIPLAILLIAPLGFFMGMPFPLGLGALGAEAPQMVPWAWGINGCASVISAVLATLLAIHFGFTVLVLLSLLLYALAAASFPRARASESPA